jgi:PAS domain S-box-containing protein
MRSSFLEMGHVGDTGLEPRGDEGEAEIIPRLIDENEQLRTMVESLLEENGHLIEHRDRLSARLTNLSRQLQAAHAATAIIGPPPAPPASPSPGDERDRQAEELGVAFEELQVLTEELEAANSALSSANRELDARMTERLQEVARTKAALKVSEASFQTVADLVPDLLWGADTEGQGVWFNRRWAEQTGQSAKDASGEGWLEALHPADQPMAAEAWRRAVKSGEAFHHECRIRSGEDFHWALIRAELVRDEQGRLVRWFGAATDIHEQRMAMEALKRSELRFKTLIEGMPPLVWRAVDTGTWTWASPQWQAFTGLSAEASFALGWLDALHEDDRQAARDAWERAQETGALEFEARIFSVASGSYRHFHTRAAPVRDEHRRVIEWLGASSDIHDLVELRKRQDVLLAELQHRTRNIMAVVRALTKRTITSSASLEDFSERIDERLAALARVQGLLSRRHEGARVTFEALLKAELSAHVADLENGRVTLRGPSDVGLRSATVQTFALALHELATNAVKYGALAAADGHLSVVWHVTREADDKPWLHVEWVESGVSDMPAGDTPARGGGYGLELIRRALPYQLSAKTQFSFGEDGVRCLIDVPLPDEMTEARP